MKFLMIAKMRHPVSPDIATGLFDDLTAWSKKYVATKQMEQTWGFAGMYAGGGILNVKSLEELDSVSDRVSVRALLRYRSVRAHGSGRCGRAGQEGNRIMLLRSGLRSR